MTAVQLPAYGMLRSPSSSNGLKPAATACMSLGAVVKIACTLPLASAANAALVEPLYTVVHFLLLNLQTAALQPSPSAGLRRRGKGFFITSPAQRMQHQPTSPTPHAINAPPGFLNSGNRLTHRCAYRVTYGLE
jgi:hypothetical protein